MMVTEIEKFIQHVHRHNPEAHTWRNYASDLRQFVTVIGDCQPSEVTPKLIDQFVFTQVEKGFEPTTINRRLAAIVSLYTFLAANDENLVCPVKPHRHRLREPQRLAHPMSEDTLQRFFAVLEKPREKAMFAILRDCGLRISELANLKITDLDLENIYPRFIARGKGSKDRTLYVADSALKALKAYLTTRPSSTSEYVFLSYQNKGMSSLAIHKNLAKCRKQAGVSLTAHDFRHRFATSLHTAKMPVTSIQRLLGHCWLQTTQGYLQVSDEQVRGDYEAACAKLQGWTANKMAVKKGRNTSRKIHLELLEQKPIAWRMQIIGLK